MNFPEIELSHVCCLRHLLRASSSTFPRTATLDHHPLSPWTSFHTRQDAAPALAATGGVRVVAVVVLADEYRGEDCAHEDADEQPCGCAPDDHHLLCLLFFSSLIFGFDCLLRHCPFPDLPILH